MTPKEKAEELIGKCYDTFVNDEDEHYTGTAWRLSKQCALIAVNEQISLYNELNQLGLIKENSIGFELAELKDEINKL